MSNQGVAEILDLLDDQELVALTNIITQGLLRDQIKSRKDALEAIFRVSTDDISILSRKCITRELLFKYAYQKNIKVNVPITKMELIDKIRSFWKNSEGAEIVSNSKVEADTDVNNMAMLFTKWFYEILNGSFPPGREHFFNDAKLTVNFLNEEEEDTQTIENDVFQITNLLFKIRQENDLVFNPNLHSEGVHGKREPHGFVLVLSCGTLHVKSDCVGVFEQVFLLARDPTAENNWKIKKTNLVLRKKHVMTVPKLCDSKLSRDILQLPST